MRANPFGIRKESTLYVGTGLTFNIAEAKNSIRKIASYEFELLLPGHGPPILTDASKKVKEFVASLS